MANIAVDTELAWAAGLFDGEGTVNAHVRRNGYTAITMAVAMCNEEAVSRFALAVGVGKVEQLKRPTLGGKTVWRWQVCALPKVEQALEKLWPYLCMEKLTNAELALSKRRAAIAALEKTNG